MPEQPETPEGVAYALLHDVARAEGNPVEQLTEDTKPERAGNQNVRQYILDTYSECLTATKGDRLTSTGGTTRPRRGH